MILRYVSLYWTFIPIITGLVVFRKLDNPTRVILFLLIYGLISDMIVGNENIDKSLRFFLFNLYGLVEALSLSWYLIHLSKSRFLSRFGKALWIILPLFWIYSHRQLFIDPSVLKFSAVFEPTYLMLLSILSGYLLIKIAETNYDLFSNGLFLLIFAIFINCFCIFFIKTLMETSFIRKIWYFQSLLNMLVYSMVSLAFIKLAKNADSDRNISLTTES
jgi:hypothetical protein